MFKKAFQACFRKPDEDINKLMKYAKRMNIETEIITFRDTNDNPDKIIDKLNEIKDSIFNKIFGEL